MEQALQDFKYGFRMLLKSRSLSAAASLALMLGIGANTAIFSVVNAVLLKPLPYPQPEQLVRLRETSAPFGLMSIAYPNFLDWRDRNTSFEKIAAFRSDGFNLSGSGAPERVQGRVVSASFLAALRVKLAMGRDFVAEDDKPGASPTVIISNGFWQRRFGQDPNQLGKPLTLNGKDYTVVGILPARFSFYSPADLYIPIGLSDDITLRNREVHPGIRAIGRLKQSVTIDQAQAELSNIASALAEQYPNSNKDHGVAVASMYEDTVANIRPILLVMLGAVCFVLLIACANVANLLLARAAARQKEIAIRSALGANRIRIVRQLLSESVLLALVGGGLGLLLAMWGADALVAAIPQTIPRAENIGIDVTVLIFTLAVSVVTGIVFGLFPALQASKPNLNELLKEGGRGSTGSRHRVRGVLVVSEVALALVLLIGAGLMIRSILSLRGVAPGLDPHNVLTMQVPLASAAYDDPARVRTFFRQMLERVSSTPGVQAAGIANSLPLSGNDNELPFWIGNRQRPAQADMLWSLFYPVSAGYLKAMSIPLLDGRFITDQDTEKTARVVVVDEALARGVFPGEDPVGKQLTIQGLGDIPDMRCEIVGVVGHVKHWGLDSDATQTIQHQLYLPFDQVPDQFVKMLAQGVTLLARTNSDPMAMASSVQTQVNAVDKDQPVNNIMSMEQIISASISQQRFSMLLLGIFGAVALMLAALGIYGVMSYSVTQRTNEIGIRVALGASQSDVLKLVVGQGMTLALIGMGIGLAAAFGLTRLMASLLFGVSATDPLTFASIALVLAGVALLACYLPARRATKVDPMIALRYE